MLPLYFGLSASVRGAGPGHEVNQDATRWGPLPGGGVFLAVADGHGSPRSFRSHQGAALAVDEAARQWSSLPGQEPLSGVKRWLTTSLPARLVAGWQAAARGHASEHPLDPDERGRYEAAYRGPPPADLPLTLYGTTLLTAAVRPGYLALAGVGDGEALLLDEEGQAQRPLGEDPRHLANETTSLASPDAVRDVRVVFQALLDRPPALVLLSTDGYPNCFETPGHFEEAARELLDRLRRRGVDRVAERLPGWLQEASRAGSGDDASVALLVREDLVDHGARKGESLKAPASMAAILGKIR